MRLKKVVAVFLFISVFTIIFPTVFIKPFDYLKDILFSSVHALSSDVRFSFELEESIIRSLKEDIEELKKINNIELSISEFDTVNTTIISRNIDYWFNTITINKGSVDGIEIDMAVVDSEGLIGRISQVTNHTATVKLITTNDVNNKVSAVINNQNNKVYGIISGYDSKNNLLYLTINDDINIPKNSKVETTGMGGVFPSGILIGKVVDKIKKDDGITNIIRIRPSSNIEGERYVSVLQRKQASSN